MMVDEFDFDQSIPSLGGKRIVVTGGTAGLGAEAIARLAAKSPAQILFTGRNQSAADANVKTWQASFPDVDFVFILCDLASFASIDQASMSILNQCPQIDILIASAGIMAIEPRLTDEGFESQFGTNHMGHALLIRCVLPRLLEVQEPRVVLLTSQGHALAPGQGIDYDDVKPPSGKVRSPSGFASFKAKWVRYGQSKLANILYAEQLGLRYPQISTVAIHPGVISENGLVSNLGLMHRLFVTVPNIGKTISVANGSKNICWAATCTNTDLTGVVYAEPVGEKTALARRLDEKREEWGQHLWDWTEAELNSWMNDNHQQMTPTSA